MELRPRLETPSAVLPQLIHEVAASEDLFVPNARTAHRWLSAGTV